MTSGCKTCSFNAFVTENGEKVCTNCGDVQEECLDGGNLCLLPDTEAIVENLRNKEFETNERLTGRIRNETNDGATRQKINREKLVHDMKKTVKQLLKHPSAIEETVELIKTTLQGYNGRLLSSKRSGLMGACIYYVSAKHQLGITLSDICKKLDIKMKVISVCLKQVRQLCPEFEYERPNIKDIVKKTIDEMTTKYYDLVDDGTNSKPDTPREPQPLIDSKDRLVLQNRVMLLISLYEAMHPYQQPSPNCLVNAVVYHAWRSLDTFKLIAINLTSRNTNSSSHDPKEDLSTSAVEHIDEHQHERRLIKAKHTIGFEKFCQICSLRHTSNGQRLVTKLQSTLLELGRFLGDVNKINLPWFLKDIIENSQELIQVHQRSETNS